MGDNYRGLPLIEPPYNSGLFTVGLDLRMYENVLAIVTIVHYCMQFFGDLQEDVMLNYPRTDVLMTTARVALFFTLLCSYPVLLHPTRGAINRLVIYSYQLLTGSCRRKGRKGGKVAHTNELEKQAEAEEEARVKGEEKVPLLQQQKTKSSSDVKVGVCLSLFSNSLSLSLSLSPDSSANLDQ